VSVSRNALKEIAIISNLLNLSPPGKMTLSTRQIPYIAATIVLFVTGVLFFAFPIRNLFEAYIPGSNGTTASSNPALIAIPVAATVYMGLLYLFVVVTFFLASFVDPGIYPREQTDEEDDFRQPLYKVIEINGIQLKMKWCDTCKFYRPPRCSHCSICDNCVEQFDHHCPWVDNCVGRRNYKYFFFFITSLTVFILSGFVWAILSILLHSTELHKVAVEFVLLFVGVCVFIPVVGLAGFHIGLVCMGRTTNEHVTGKFRGGHNPFNQGCVKNCASVVCGPKKPRYMHYKMKAYFPLQDSRQRILSQSSHGPQSPHGSRPRQNDLRCMPVYEELDNTTGSLQRSGQLPQALNGNNNTMAQIQPSQRLPNGMNSAADSSGSESIPPSLATTNVHDAGTIVMTEITV